MSETEETMKAIQEGSKAANNLMNKIASVTGFFFDVRKHTHDAQKSIIDEIANRTDINPIERMAIISNCKKAIKHYKNSNSIFEKAIKDLEPNAMVEAVSDDWIEFFFDKAEKVSDKDIQIVWGKILSNEVNEPGVVPKSLLNTIYNLDDRLATVFSHLCEYVLHTEDGGFIALIPFINENKDIFNNSGISYLTLTELQRHGLIVFNNLIEYGIDSKDKDSIKIPIRNKLYMIKPINERINFGNVLLTEDGQALCKCIYNGMHKNAVEIAENYWKDAIEHEYIQLLDNQYVEVNRKQTV